MRIVLISQPHFSLNYDTNFPGSFLSITKSLLLQLGKSKIFVLNVIFKSFKILYRSNSNILLNIFVIRLIKAKKIEKFGPYIIEPQVQRCSLESLSVWIKALSDITAKAGFEAAVCFTCNGI